MNITIGANCWDGTRKEFLSDIVNVSKITNPTRLLHVDKRMYDPKVRSILGYTIPLTFLASCLPSFSTHIFAASAPEAAVPAISSAVKTKIIHAFDPLIDLIMSLSFPIAGVMIAGGCLFILVGNRERGMQMLQNAAIGYILVQLSPLFLDLLVGIGDSV
ncbi:hypothetical protein [Paenibacillus sp. LPE1-1-1.1]|uniref:hypothetical protein n=1 Tax=Paenibacillus sp. LPE1-1-1.1 TaxID=3135230 RepID=UPI003440A905